MEQVQCTAGYVSACLRMHISTHVSSIGFSSAQFRSGHVMVCHVMA